MSSVGDNIRNLRESAHITQDDLAEMAGVNRVTIAKYESGKIMPGAITLARLAKALHVSADVLLGNGEDDMSEDEKVFWQMREDYRSIPELYEIYSLSRKADKDKLKQIRDFAQFITKGNDYDETDTP